MKLTCDLCSSVLTEAADGTAQCQNCGLEYGADRLQEMRAALPPVEPEQPQPQPVQPQQQTTQPQQKSAKKSSARGTVLLILGILAILSLLSGVFVTAVIFGVIMLLILLLWKPAK